jgi:hypothetical protein
MSELDDYIEIHSPTCELVGDYVGYNLKAKCDCGRDAAAAELAVMRSALEKAQSALGKLQQVEKYEYQDGHLEYVCACCGEAKGHMADCELYIAMKEIERATA